MIRVGIVGHRYLDDDRTVMFIYEQCLAILKKTLTEHASIVALSAIAEGADTLFAESALTLGIPLEIARPFKHYASDFVGISARKRYHRLRSAACRETEMPYINRSDEAYLAAMNWVVKRSDILVAAWDGLPATGVGGTGDAVEQAILLNRTWIHLNVTDLSVTFHGRSSRSETKQGGNT
jgi:hypothetical protein